MSNPANPYEPLTSENSALVLVDHQVGLMTQECVTTRLQSLSITSSD
jgi:hypothetical protein